MFVYLNFLYVDLDVNVRHKEVFTVYNIIASNYTNWRGESEKLHDDSWVSINHSHLITSCCYTNHLSFSTA